MKRILITFAGGQLGRGITSAIRAARPAHIIGADADGYALFQSDAEERYIIPRADEPDYLDVLRDLVRRTEPDLVWPMHDNEIALVVADQRELGAPTFLPPRETVEICHNKFASYETFRAAEVPVPDTMMLDGEGDLAEAFRRFDGEVWIRPISGAGARGALGTTDKDLATIWINHYDGWGHYSAAERLTQQMYTFESVWHEGELIVGQSNVRNIATSRRMGYLGGATTPGLGVRRRKPASEQVKEVAMAAARAVSGGKPHGIYSVDMNDDRNGVPNVTEINIGRFGTSGAICFYNRGANFPEIALRVAFGEDFGFNPPLVDPLHTDVSVVYSIGSQPVEIDDREYGPLVREYEQRRNQLS